MWFFHPTNKFLVFSCSFIVEKYEFYNDNHQNSRKSEEFRSRSHGNVERKLNFPSKQCKRAPPNARRSIDFSISDAFICSFSSEFRAFWMISVVQNTSRIDFCHFHPGKPINLSENLDKIRKFTNFALNLFGRDFRDFLPGFFVFFRLSED